MDIKQQKLLEKFTEEIKYETEQLKKLSSYYQDKDYWKAYFDGLRDSKSILEDLLKSGY